MIIFHHLGVETVSLWASGTSFHFFSGSWSKSQYVFFGEIAHSNPSKSTFLGYILGHLVIFPWFAHSNPSKSRAFLGHLKWFSQDFLLGHLVIFPYVYHDFLHFSSSRDLPVAPSNRGRFAHGPPPKPPAPGAPRGHGLCAQRRAQRGAERGGGLRPRGRRGGRDVETWRPVGLGNSRKNGGFMRFSWGKSWEHLPKSTWRFEWIWLMISWDFMGFHGIPWWF